MLKKYSSIVFFQNGSSASLELDLEHYVVPAPSISANSALVYAANNAENPRFSNVDGPGNASFSYKDSVVSADRPATIKVYLGHLSCRYTINFHHGLQKFKST
jgi:hypothetical protein